jgi:hypothetical protein
MSGEREKKADLFRELTLDVYRQINEANVSIDSKTHNMLALAIGLLPLILGLFYFVISNSSQVRIIFPSVVLISLACGVALFVTAIVIGAWSYRPRDFDSLQAHGFLQDHKDEALIDVKETAAATLATIVESNRVVVNRKAKRYASMFWLFTIGTIAFSVGFMLLLTALIN